MLGLQHRSFRGHSPVQGRVTDTWINEHLVFGGLCNFVLDISEALQWLPSCSVWISCCFCNKLPQIQCLKTLWMYYPPVLGIRSLESRGWQDSVPILPRPVQPPIPYLWPPPIPCSPHCISLTVPILVRSSLCPEGWLWLCWAFLADPRLSCFSILNLVPSSLWSHMWCVHSFQGWACLCLGDHYSASHMVSSTFKLTAF